MSEQRPAAVEHRYGARRTTMDDIAAEAGMSRPAVYQYVRGKDDVFARLAGEMFARCLGEARAAAAGPGGFADRLHAVLTAKLDLVLRLWQDSPHHAGELIGDTARVSADAQAAFEAALRELLTGLVRTARAGGELPRGGPPAAAVADVALALTRGIEADPRDPDAARGLLRRGVALLATGLGGATRPQARPRPDARSTRRHR